MRSDSNSDCFTDSHALHVFEDGCQRSTFTNSVPYQAHLYSNMRTNSSMLVSPRNALVATGGVAIRTFNVLTRNTDTVLKVKSLA